jgi:cation transport regulator
MAFPPFPITNAANADLRIDLAQVIRLQARYMSTGPEGVGRGKADMPYATNLDLQPPVRRVLPEHAQDIYREAFNHAFATYGASARGEERAHRIAWAAVKRSYCKADGAWVARKKFSEPRQ